MSNKNNAVKDLPDIRLSEKSTELVVSIINAIIEKCGYNVSEYGIGYDPATLEISSANCDSVDETLSWVFDNLIPKININHLEHSDFGLNFDL